MEYELKSSNMVSIQHLYNESVVTFPTAWEALWFDSNKLTLNINKTQMIIFYHMTRK